MFKFVAVVFAALMAIAFAAPSPEAKPQYIAAAPLAYSSLGYSPYAVPSVVPGYAAPLAYSAYAAPTVLV